LTGSFVLKKRNITYVLTAILILAVISGLSGCDMPGSSGDDLPLDDRVEEVNILVQEPGANPEEDQPYFALEGSEVSLGDKMTTADSAGVATFANIEKGIKSLSVKINGYKTYETNLEVSSDTANYQAELIQENSARIDPDSVIFSRKEPDDISTEITWNDAAEVVGLYKVIEKAADDSHFKIQEIVLDEGDLPVKDSSRNTLILQETDITDLTEEYDEIKLFIKFDEGSDALLTVEVKEQETQEDAELDPEPEPIIRLE